MNDLWKRKLLAYLHDPPSKPFNVAEHREVADTLVRNAFPEMAPADAAWFFDKVCDHTAAAADRVVCPKARAMRAGWQAEAATFKHPLGGGELHFEQKITATLAEDIATQAQPYSLPYDRLPAAQQAWARFFCHWRLWPQRASQRDPRLAHAPADTRIPDHTIWTHCSLVSALQACVEFERQGDRCERREFKPAFLLVQVGPVQDFISQARTTRDLWSGSYLLSWLVAHGIKAVTDVVGPDCVLFPALRGQPLFDFLHRAGLYEPLGLWTAEEKLHADEQVLRPTLPNRFLAVVPEGKAAALAAAAKTAMETELRESISRACLDWIAANGGNHPITGDALNRWHQQLRQFLTVHWQVWPWQPDVKKTMQRFEELPTGRFGGEDKTVQAVPPAAALQRAYEAATRGIPFEDLDPRNYKHRSWKEGGVWKSACLDANDNDLRPGGEPVLENPGFAWPAHYAEAEFRLAARRNTRDFEPWGEWSGGQCRDLDRRDGSVKDMLSGKEEVIGSAAWQKGLATLPGHHFGENERLGAMNLIKRIWHLAYLKKEKGLERLPRFDSVPAVAAASWVSSVLLKKTAEAGKARDLFVETDGFGPLASNAADCYPADIQNWESCNEQQWVRRSDNLIFHSVEWDRAIRAIRDETKPEAKAKLQTARDALLRLQGERGLNSQPSRYVAVLALDGDSMGEWVSGAKSPLLETQLAEEAKNYFQDHELLRRLMRCPRHVSPSYHLQFSESLANFSLYLAAPIVDFFDGQLIYSGGDDVLAMLPAERALGCARALRMAFRGDPDLATVFAGVLDTRLKDAEGKLLPPEKQPAWGFVAMNGEWEGWHRWQRDTWPRGYHLLVPGWNADISAGIAVGHMHTPLQNLVEAAREAEKRAKKKEGQGGYGKAAFAVALFKRSGETIEWGAKWDSRAIALAERFATLSQDGWLSARFPYALAGFLRPYDTRCYERERDEWQPFRLRPANGFDPMAVFPAEFHHVLDQQTKPEWRASQERHHFEQLATKFLTEDCPGRMLDDFLGPFLTTTFIQRGGQ